MQKGNALNKAFKQTEGYQKRCGEIEDENKKLIVFLKQIEGKYLEDQKGFSKLMKEKDRAIEKLKADMQTYQLKNAYKGDNRKTSVHIDKLE